MALFPLPYPTIDSRRADDIKAFADLIEAERDIITALSKATQLRCYTLGRRLAQATDRLRFSHLRTLVTRAVAAGLNLVDLEGMVYGRTFGSADMVVFEAPQTYRLYDMTISHDLTTTKLQSLQAAVMALTTAHPGWTFTASIARVDLTEPMFASEPVLSDETIQFARDYAASFPVENAEVAVEAAATAIAQECRRHAFPDATEVKFAAEAYQAVAAGDTSHPDFLPAANDALSHFPELNRWARSSLQFVKLGFRGVPPPSGPAFDAPTGWPGAILRLKAGAKCVAFAPGKMPIEIDEAGDREPGDTVFIATGPKTFKVIAGAGDPVFAEMTTRIAGEPTERSHATQDPIQTILAAELLCRPLECSPVHSVSSRASGLLAATGSTGAMAIADKIAASAATAFASTVAGASVAVTASVANLSVACQGGPGPFTWAEAFSGAVLMIVRKAGDVNQAPAFSRLVAVRSPCEFPSTWTGPSEVDGKEQVWCSRALLATEHMDAWMGIAEANSLVKLAGYIDGAVSDTTATPQMMAECSTTIGLAALCARRPMAVAMKLQRTFMTGAISPVCDLDGLASKLDGVVCRYPIDTVLLGRMVVRACCAAVLRFGGTTEACVVDDGRGAKTSIAIPFHLRAGRATMQLVANSFYDGDIGPVVGASMALDDALAMSEATEAAREYTAAGRATFGASDCCLSYWRAGRISDFFGLPNWLDHEVEFAVQRARRGGFFGASLLATCAEASIVAQHPEHDRRAADAWARAAVKSVSELMTMKRATGRQTEAERAASTAYQAVADFISTRCASGFDISRTTAEVLGQYDRLATTDALGAWAAYASTQVTPAVFVLIAKEFSIEKARDIIFLDATTRLVQAAVEGYAKEFQHHLECSAMAARDKFSVLQALFSFSRDKHRMYPIHVATDRSKYGTTRDLAAMAAGLIRLRAPALVTSLQLRLIDILAAKSLRVSDRLASLSQEQVAALPVPGPLARTLTAALNTPTRSVRVPCGMGQGIMQQSADTVSALTSKFTERVLRCLGFDAMVRTTNDDGAISVRAPIGQLQAAPPIIVRAAALCASVFAEKLNLTKVFASSIVQELNTRLMVNGARILPWVRSAFSLGDPVPTSSTVESCHATLSRTNTMVAEGAPAFAAHLASAVAWAVHFEVFRMTAQSQASRYLSDDPGMLGPPIIAPFAVAAYGPAAVRASRLMACGASARHAASWCILSGLGAMLDPGDATDWAAISVPHDGKTPIDVAVLTHKASRMAHRASKVASPITDATTVADVLACDGTAAGAILSASLNAFQATAGRPLEGVRIGRAMAHVRIAAGSSKYRVTSLGPDGPGISVVSQDEAIELIRMVDWRSELPRDVAASGVVIAIASAAEAAAQAIKHASGRHGPLEPHRAAVSAVSIDADPVGAAEIISVISTVLGGIPAGPLAVARRRMGAVVFTNPLDRPMGYRSTMSLLAQARSVAMSAARPGISSALVHSEVIRDDATALALVYDSNIGLGLRAPLWGTSLPPLEGLALGSGSSVKAFLGATAWAQAVQVCAPGSMAAPPRIVGLPVYVDEASSARLAAATTSGHTLSTSAERWFASNDDTRTCVIASRGFARRVRAKVSCGVETFVCYITRHCIPQPTGRVEVKYSLLSSRLGSHMVHTQGGRLSEASVVRPNEQVEVVALGVPLMVFARTKGALVMLCAAGVTASSDGAASPAMPELPHGRETTRGDMAVAQRIVSEFRATGLLHTAWLHALVLRPLDVATRICQVVASCCPDFASLMSSRHLHMTIHEVWVAFIAACSTQVFAMQEPRSLARDADEILEVIMNLDFEYDFEDDDQQAEELYGILPVGGKQPGGAPSRFVLTEQRVMEKSNLRAARFAGSDNPLWTLQQAALAVAVASNEACGPVASAVVLTALDAVFAPSTADQARWQALCTRWSLLAHCSASPGISALLDQARVTCAGRKGFALNISTREGDLQYSLAQAVESELVLNRGTVERLRREAARVAGLLDVLRR